MRKKIAIIAGGNSTESPVSLITAQTVCDNLDRNKYEVFIVHVKGTQWEVLGAEYKGAIINKDDFSFFAENQKVTFDCVFNAIHGTPGEDGKIQGYFDMLAIPYTSSGVLESAVTFDKNTCLSFLKSYDVKMAESVLILKGQNFSIDDIIAKTGIPCFVKPNNGGSSLGMSKVTKIEQLEAAIEKAFKEDRSVLVEQFIEGLELTSGLVLTKEKDIVLPITEVISKNEFFDFEAKYNAEKAIEITPARVSDEITKRCQQKSLRIAKLLNLKGIVRADFIFSNDAFYFLEINTIPGMTATSFIPQQVAAAGLNISDIYTLVIEDAMANL